MATIPLTQGFVALVDNEDLPLVSDIKWAVSKDDTTNYAHGYLNGGKVQMHRLLLDAQPGQKIDHVNRDGLDNRRSNLRFATVAENARNKRKAEGKYTSKYKGVGWSVHARKWRALLRKDGVLFHLGYFSTESAAAEAYNRAAIRHFGEFARPNVIEAVA